MVNFSASEAITHGSGDVTDRDIPSRVPGSATGGASGGGVLTAVQVTTGFRIVFAAARFELPSLDSLLAKAVESIRRGERGGKGADSVCIPSGPHVFCSGARPLAPSREGAAPVELAPDRSRSCSMFATRESRRLAQPPPARSSQGALSPCFQLQVFDRRRQQPSLCRLSCLNPRLNASDFVDLQLLWRR